MGEDGSGRAKTGDGLMTSKSSVYLFTAIIIAPVAH
jgi:hypothetical protein